MTPDDLQRIHASRGWREHRVEVLHGLDAGSVVVKGQRPGRSRWRYLALDAAAWLLRLPLLRAVPAHGGRHAQAIELRRLRALAAAGVAVPEVLHDEDEFFVLRWVGGQSLDRLLGAGGADALAWWQRGARLLVELHARGHAASQAFTRNFIAQGDALVMIDFEDDPLEAMSLPQAQARDWLAYLHSTARECPAALLRSPDLAAALRAELAQEPAEVRRLIGAGVQRLRGLRRLGEGADRGWRRHLRIVLDAVALAQAALPDAGPPAANPEVSHARHH